MFFLLLALASDTAFAWTLQSRVHSQNFTCVRATPAVAAACFATHQVGEKGTLAEGPAYDLAATTIFWRVQFDSGASGWVRQQFLVLDSLVKATPVPTRIVVFPQVAGTPVQGLASFKDTVYDQFRAPLARGVTWSTSNASVATIDSFGTAFGLAPGQVTVSAAIGSVVGNALLSVLAPPPAPPPPPPAVDSLGTMVTTVGGVPLPTRLRFVWSTLVLPLADSGRVVGIVTITVAKP